MKTSKSTLTRRIAATIWLTILLGAIALVFTSIGCSPVVGRQGDRGAVGAPGNDGRDGSDGAQGPQGLTVVGPMGPAGLNGLNGTNASIGIVPLCPGLSNYGTFVEIALCINNDLYAVYSANGGFMTYLAPGHYSSNGIGSACNLTVAVNCVVSH